MAVETYEPANALGRPDRLWYLGVLGFPAICYVVYRQLIPLAAWLAPLFPVERRRHTGQAIAAFFHEAPKVMMLLTLILTVDFLFNLIF